MPYTSMTGLNMSNIDQLKLSILDHVTTPDVQKITQDVITEIRNHSYDGNEWIIPHQMKIQHVYDNMSLLKDRDFLQHLVASVVGRILNHSFLHQISRLCTTVEQLHEVLDVTTPIEQQVVDFLYSNHN